MNIADNLNIIAPSIFNEPFSEAEVLGAITYLWSHHEYYREIAIYSMLEVIIPMIQTKQFALFTENNRPIGYICWAYMNQETEVDYLENSGEIERFVGVNNGPQLWILKIFAEPNCSKKLYRLSKQYLFPNVAGKTLYHRSKDVAKVINL